MMVLIYHKIIHFELSSVFLIFCPKCQLLLHHQPHLEHYYPILAVIFILEDLEVDLRRRDTVLEWFLVMKMLDYR